jgi:hypothetical protein
MKVFTALATGFFVLVGALASFGSTSKPIEVQQLNLVAKFVAI